MKFLRIIQVVILLGILFTLGSGTSQAMVNQDVGDVSNLNETWSGMPPRPIPEKPIPHHDTGKPSKAARFTTEAFGINEQGLEQAYTLTGLDALLADGVIDDPFAGNYSLVDLDKIMFSSYIDQNNFFVETFDITPTLHVIQDSGYSLGNYNAHDIAAGDLNGDGQMEQIAAWIDGTGLISMSIGEIPSKPAKTSSAPAALAHNDGTGDLLVRGYDDAMWHSHFDGDTWGSWVSAGGTLLSAPAIVSRGAGQFDAFAIDKDNMTRWQHWEGGVFSGTWELVDVEGYWPEVEWVPPIPEVDAPAVVAHAGGGLDLFRRGPDNTLRWRHFDGNAWEDWVSLDGFLSSAPSAVALEGGGVQVFGRGLDGNIWYRIYSGGSWGSWLWLELPEGITAASAPSAVSPQAGQINLYLRGSDDALWHTQYSGGDWGAWVPGGGELGSQVAAAVWSDHSELFAQKINDRLQHSSDGVNWGDFESLPAQVIYDTGIQAALPDDVTSPYGLENHQLDIETGYFTGEMSQQIVMAYQLDSSQFQLMLLDVRDGFVPYSLAELTTPITSKASHIVAADVNADGVDDIAVVSVSDDYHYQVSIYHTHVEDDVWSLVPGVSSDSIYVDIPFGGTLRIASGDLNGDLDDEVVVLSDWVTHEYGLKTAVLLYIFDDEEPATDNANWWFKNEIGCSGGTCYYYSTGYGLAVGNVKVDPMDDVDEIVLTWPSGIGFEDDNWHEHKRELQILDAREYPDQPPVALTNYVFPYWEDDSYLDTLAVGDLDRDLVDEIVFREDNQISVYELDYEVDPAVITKTAFKDFTPQVDFYSKLVTGDFTGESLRIGTPTFRTQVDTGGIAAIINQPPKHIDILDGVTYDINSTDTDTHASYENEQSQSTSMSIQVQRDYDFAKGMAWGVGDPQGTHVAGSIDLTYGRHFENTTTAFKMIEFGENVKATNDDIVIYTGQSIQVWEYPAYQDDSGVPSGRIMVVFPQPGLSNYGAQQYLESGNSSCDFWYAPEHQINNVWSYALSQDQLIDFNGEILNQLQTVTVGPTENNLWTHWSQITETQRASSFALGVDRMFEMQIGGDTFKMHLTPAGVGVSKDVHLPYVKGTLQNSYSLGALSTFGVSGGVETTVSIHLNSIDPSGQYNYQITPYLYWAKDGYLVLDYLTNPLINQGFWQKYKDTPDPAFILPWASGQCPGKELFSKDIQISPPFATNGETVAITATVHNFSNVSVNDLKVRFYQGEPDAGIQIGTDQTIDLPPRGKVDVTTTWEANGTAQQRIYVVIDPGHQVMEMHDETTNPENNNNVGFGMVAMGNSGYVDPGGQVYFDYQYLTYTDTMGLPASVYIPTAAMTETVHLEMTPLAKGVTVRRGFKLDAYKGGSNRDNPWDLTFQPMPAAVWLHYSDADIAGLEENTLTLSWYNEDENQWEDAACGEYQRYPDDNSMIVPVCNVGEFAILSPYKPVYLPVVTR